MITLSIDVLALDKSRFKHVTKRDGSKACYVELIMIETPNSEYGDFFVKQSVTKEERLARKEMPILGNGKQWEPAHARQVERPRAASDAEPSEDSVPF
jgi:hypothetical protein